MISIRDLHKSFGRNKVLNGLNLNVSPGKIYAVLGPNGSGKTTLIKCILGMVLADKGEIEVLGENIKQGLNYRKEIDYLPQIANFPGNLKVKELIGMITDLRGGQVNESELIELFELRAHLSTRMANLSGGTKQKVNLLLAFMFDSPLLILDEPNTGLDPGSLIKLKKLITHQKTLNKTLLITTHVMQFVEEVADEVIYILEGTIYFKGTVAELKQKTGQHNMESAVAELMNRESHV